MRQTIIKQFLQLQESWALELWKDGLEIQVNVAQDNGIKSDKGYKTATESWFPFRISESRNIKIPFDLGKHVEGIGFSGWDYEKKCSWWVGFDFDSILGHKKGLLESEIQGILERVKEIPWVTARKSTSGNGIHLYVMFKNPPTSNTRKDHVNLAKRILSSLSALLNFDFKNKVDTAGTILWVWHRKATKKESFELLKKGELLETIPPVIDTVEVKDISASLKVSKLDVQQRALLVWFSKQNSAWWWNAELNMLVCHTTELKKAHEELKLRGLYHTIATGKDLPNDYNCFAFPLKNGSWIVRRFNPGCQEHAYWKTDKSNWTYCFFNRIPTLDDLSPIFNGTLSSKKDFVFNGMQGPIDILKILSPNTKLNLPAWCENRQFRLKDIGNSKVSISFNREDHDPLINNWIGNKHNWEKVVNTLEEEIEISTPDNVIRHVISGGNNAGWYLNVRNDWVQEPRQNIYSALIALNYPKGIIEDIMGQCILNSWLLVNHPFASEYPGNRQWNKFSPQLMFDPKPGDWSKWKQILEHVGNNLNVTNNNWCIAHGVNTGYDYLFLWCASLFQFPTEPLPYLFLYGPQLSGKSTFHEALSLLVNRGVVRADTALTSMQRFNAELAGSILCIVEETDLSTSKVAYDRIKDWTTSKILTLHEKGKTPFELENTTHWIQCANTSSACPIKLGDTRIVIIPVDMPIIIESKNNMFIELKKQAGAFLYELLNVEIPPASDRLRIPVIETAEKIEEQYATANPVEQFILTVCYKRKGHYILFSDFCIKFKMWLESEGLPSIEWSKIKIQRAISMSKDMPVKGRVGDHCNIALGNITFDPNLRDEQWEWQKAGERLVRSNNY